MKKMVVVLLAIMLLVGCASENTANTNADTKSVETIMGTIEVPVNPKRVVVNWYVGDVLALDLDIVGYFAWNQASMTFHDQLNKLHQIEAWEPEEIMSLEPDLIVTYSEDDFENLSKIAPVLVIGEGEYDSVGRIEFLAEVTNREAEAKVVVDTFNTKLEAAKETLKNDAFVDKTFSIMEDWGPTGEWSGVYYETGSRGGTLLYSYLGLEYSDKLGELITKTGEHRGHLSYEVAHEYFGDYIIWFQQEGKESEYAKTEIWKSIPAVKEGRVVEVPGEMLGLFFYSDILSLTGQLDYMVEAINSIAQ